MHEECREPERATDRMLSAQRAKVMQQEEEHITGIGRRVKEGLEI